MKINLSLWFIVFIIFLGMVYLFKSNMNKEGLTSEEKKRQNELKNIENTATNVKDAAYGAAAAGGFNITDINKDSTNLLGDLKGLIQKALNSKDEEEEEKLKTESDLNNTIDTTQPTCNKTFFHGANDDGSFCKEYGKDPKDPNLNRICNSLNAESCNLTGCCVWLNGKKCVSGDIAGPSIQTDRNDKDIDYAYYSYKNMCYGSCGKGMSFSANPCSQFKEDDTGISKECLRRLWHKTKCPNMNFIDDTETENLKDYTKRNIEKKFLLADKPKNYRSCYGPDEDYWPPPCDKTTDTSFGLSARCLRKLFNEEGCPYTPTINDVFVENNKHEPKSAMITKFKKFFYDKTASSYRNCYGPDEKDWPDPCIHAPDLTHGATPYKLCRRSIIQKSNCSEDKKKELISSYVDNFLAGYSKEYIDKWMKTDPSIKTTYNKDYFTKMVNEKCK